MACPKWGSGAKWGDGSLWCRQFGTTPYMAMVDQQVFRLSVRLNFTGSTDFYLDSIRPDLNLHGQLPHRWQAIADTNAGERISAQVLYSSGVAPGNDFYIDNIRLLANVRRKQPQG